MSESAELDTNVSGFFRRLESPEERFRILFEGIPNPFFYVDTRLQVQFANAEFTGPLGRAPEEIVGAPIADVLGPHEYALHGAYLERALEGEHVVYEHREAADDGAERFVRISNMPVRADDDSVKGVFCEYTDITALKRLESDARRTEARFKSLAQSVPNQLLLLDRNLRIEFANEVFLEASGWSHEAALGRHISEVAGYDRYLERRPYYERALAGETLAYESTGAAGTRSGYFQFSYRPNLDENGEVRGILSLATDISERRRIELELERKQEELLRSNRDLEQFAYVASHDLKAPLRSIEVLVDWIREDLEDHASDEVHENLGLLAQRSRRLARLLDDLLAYSRAGRQVGELREVDCSALVADTIELLDPPEGMRVEAVGEMPTLTTYQAPLQQALFNLIGNAIKHHPGPTGAVTVSCEARGDHYRFSVEDDGAGIPAEYAERVFEMFQTLKPRDELEGSGMGLAIVNRIVQWQGGRIWFEPAGGGTGTAFRFEWLTGARDSAEDGE